MEPVLACSMVKVFYNSIEYTIGYQPMDTDSINNITEYRG